MSGDPDLESIDFDQLISERAIKEFYRNESKRDSIILTSFQQYRLEDVADMPSGDYDRLYEAAISVQAHRDIMALMIAASAQDKKATKRLLASLEKIADRKD